MNKIERIKKELSLPENEAIKKEVITSLKAILEGYHPEQWEPDEAERELYRENGMQWAIDENKEKRYIESERIKIAEAKREQETQLKGYQTDFQNYKSKDVEKFLSEKINSISNKINFCRYLSDIIFQKNLSEIDLIKAFLEGDSQAVKDARIHLTKKERLKVENIQNERNVNFKYVIYFPDGTKSMEEGTTYQADFEELTKKFQLSPGQNEQFKITMKIEITNTQRSKNNYQDLMQHFRSRPPLRMSPVPDVVREVRNNQKEMKRDMAVIKKTGQDTNQTIHNVTDKRYKGVKEQRVALGIEKTKMNNIRRQNPELKDKNGATILQLREAASKYKPETRSNRKAKK